MRVIRLKRLGQLDAGIKPGRLLADSLPNKGIKYLLKNRDLARSAGAFVGGKNT